MYTSSRGKDISTYYNVSELRGTAFNIQETDTPIHSVEEIERCTRVGRALSNSRTLDVDIDEANELCIASKPGGPRSKPLLEVIIKGFTSLPESEEANSIDSSSNTSPKSSSAQGSHGGIFQPSHTAPAVIDSTAPARRDTPVTLWKQHLQYLMSKEDKKYAAVCEAFALRNPQSWNPVYRHIEKLIRKLDRKL